MSRALSILILRRPSPSFLSESHLRVPMPVYFKSISRSGRSVHWSCNVAVAMRLPRAKWEKLRAKYPRQLTGRLVKAP